MSIDADDVLLLPIGPHPSLVGSAEPREAYGGSIFEHALLVIVFTHALRIHCVWVLWSSSRR